jgi:hypothetical protein
VCIIVFVLFRDSFYEPEVRLSIKLLLRRTACTFSNSIEHGGSAITKCHISLMLLTLYTPIIVKFKSSEVFCLVMLSQSEAPDYSTMMND